MQGYLEYWELAQDIFDTLLNPTLIVEVLSASTETYDRDEKFTHYRQIDTLQEYILISQDSVEVVQYCRQEPRMGGNKISDT